MTTIYHGWLHGSTDSLQMPDIKFNYGYIKGMTDNTGNCFVGSSSDVAIAGTTDTNTTTGFVIDSNEVLPVDGPMNLKDFWYICDNATDDLIYWLYL